MILDRLARINCCCISESSYHASVLVAKIKFGFSHAAAQVLLDADAEGLPSVGVVLSGLSLAFALEARESLSGMTALGLCIFAGKLRWIKPILEACRCAKHARTNMWRLCLCKEPRIS